jgi:SAM-dependent methyltransferase
MKEQNINSPLTLFNKVFLIKNVNTKIIITQFKNFGIDVSQNFDVLKEVSLYQCYETGYRFYYPYNVAGDSSFYQHFQKFDWYYMPWKWEHEISTKYIKEGMKILEVGCAHGAFLERISNSFNLDKSVGLELNKSTPVNNEKWEIVNQNVQDYAKNNLEKFDLVCSYQVLEHIADVHSFIESKIACLKKSGILIISVPNNESYIKDTDGALNMPPHHMGLWTESSLISLTKVFPLKIVQVHYEELQDYHVDGYICAMKYTNGNKLINRIKLKIDKYTGAYNKFKNDILQKRRSIIGQTILIVYEKI